MLNVVQGLTITTNSPSVIAAINAYTEQCLSYGNRAEACILEAIASDPECVLANTFAAAYYLSQENAKDAKIANSYLLQARKNFNWIYYAKLPLLNLLLVVSQKLNSKEIAFSN